MLRWKSASWSTRRTYTVAITSLCIRLCPLLIFVLFCRYNCQSHCFYAHSSDAVCTANKWERSGGKSCPVVSASVCWRIQWMKDWTWIFYGVASPKSRLNSVWLFVWGIVKDISQPRIRIEYWRRVCFNDFQTPTWKMSRRTLGGIKIFLRRKGRRIQMTSN